MISKEQEELDVGAKITDEGVAAYRARIGLSKPRFLTPKYEVATRDAIKNFGLGSGDNNPLWTSPEYAKMTRWRGVIAHPAMIRATGISEVEDVPKSLLEKGRGGGLAGVHGFYSGNDIVLYRPVYEDDVLIARAFVDDVEVKPSRFAGKLVIGHEREIYYNQRGDLVADWKWWTTRTERKTASEKGKYSELTRPFYTAEMIKKIEQDIEREEIRGKNTRYWEDVKEGEELTPIVRGPLLVTDIIAWLAGADSPFVHAHKVRLEHGRRHPRSLTVNEFGVLDVVERVHWEDSFAQKIGNPMAYDYGRQRTTWLMTLVTNWIGDDGWIFKWWDRYNLFVYVGDTNWFKGKVVKKYQEDGESFVDLDLWAEDQRGRKTTSGKATVKLPSKLHGAVQLPQPPQYLDGLKPMEPLEDRLLKEKRTKN